MKGTIRATVKYGAFPQREKRFVPGTPARIIKAWKVRTLALMMKRSPQPERTAKTGTLAKDAEKYYPLVRHLCRAGNCRRGEIRAWFPHLGDSFRHTISREDVLRVRGIWSAAGVAAKTINNRLTALRDLYHKMDGDHVPTPCDGIKPLAAQKVPPRIIQPELVNMVLGNLERRAKKGRKHAAKDMARLMVYASTGKRPCEIMRAQPGDVDLRRKVWLPRDAKGGFCPGVFLNQEQIAAWEAFILEDAWGEFDTGKFARRLRDAGWPEGVKPYNLRHSTWIEASERGIDLADIQAGAGHRRIDTTRRHYVPVLHSRLQKMSESLEGRFGWATK